MDIDLNKYDAIIRFKRTAIIDGKPIILTKRVSPEPGEVNEYGEIVVGKITKEQKSLDEDEAQLLISAYHDGKTTYELAEQFGCHRNTVSSTLRKHDVSVSNQKAQKKLEPADVVAMYENMCTSAEIAKKYGVCPQAVIQCLRSQGIRIRSRWDY